jgi:hypothetical protein
MQPGEQVAPTAGGGLRIVGVPTVLDPDAVAVTAWGVLHPRIADILAARARLPAGATLGDLPEAAGEGAIARWPEVRASGPLAALPLRPRTAYLWLAWEAGLDLVTLYRVLFTRIGSWARRADDPPWVHARGYARLGALASEVGGERGS